MLIVEGPDGSGKTRLVNRLSERLEVPIASKNSTSEGGPVQDLCDWVERDLDGRAFTFASGEGRWLSIHDRYPLFSEPIYGPIVRGKLPDGWNREWYTKWIHKFRLFEPFLVVCLPPLATVLKNCLDDDTPQMPGVRDRIEAIYWMYYTHHVHWTFFGYSFPVVVWDYVAVEEHAPNSLDILVKLVHARNSTLTQDIRGQRLGGWN